uniref:TERF1-interacting nuclear factor 2 N-terminal domain-containing protein n=1 Tax=Dicentrarchus labrax TaxID=13489 RepID=A0A8C4H416_DICLA
MLLVFTTHSKIHCDWTLCTRLPLSALRLLIPPVRLVSAAMWQTIQQKVVADYGMLEEFVSMVTDIVPELLTIRQRVQLILGLRARLILELCQFEATADFQLLQPQLDRVQTLIKAWVTEVGAANMEAPHSEFVDLVKNLLTNPDEREHFFQNIFPEEFGPTYDEELHTLMWMFLSRLERFLPLQTFQQVSSVLEECMDSVCRREDLKTLLHYQKDLSQLDHNGKKEVFVKRASLPANPLLRKQIFQRALARIQAATSNSRIWLLSVIAVKTTHGLTTQMRALAIRLLAAVPVWLTHGLTTQAMSAPLSGFMLKMILCLAAQMRTLPSQVLKKYQLPAESRVPPASKPALRKSPIKTHALSARSTLTLPWELT